MNPTAADFIHDPDKGLPYDSEPVMEGFDHTGKPVDGKHWSCVARTLTNPVTKHKQYQARVCTTGGAAGELFDPAQSEISLLTANNTNTGREWYQFRDRTEESFNHYLAFLRTGNTAHRRRAERA